MGVVRKPSDILRVLRVLEGTVVFFLGLEDLVRTGIVKKHLAKQGCYQYRVLTVAETIKMLINQDIARFEMYAIL